METMNITNIVSEIKKFDTWVILIIVSIFGMLGGLAHKLTNPPEDKTTWAGHIVVGLVAALAVLFVFTPADPVRLIALSLAAGYGGKAVLDAMESKVKTALAEKETAKAKEDGQKAVEAGKEAINHALKLAQIKTGMETAFMEGTKQPRAIILETLKTKSASDLHAFIVRPHEETTDELKKLANKLDMLKESFQK